MKLHEHMEARIHSQLHSLHQELDELARALKDAQELVNHPDYVPTRVLPEARYHFSTLAHNIDKRFEQISILSYYAEGARQESQ